jgi:predicted small integral membrane protein
VLEYWGTGRFPILQHSNTSVLQYFSTPIRKIIMGFLPIETDRGDRVFISVVIGIAIHLLWMRFLEKGLPIWVATILSVIIGIIIFKKG